MQLVDQIMGDGNMNLKKGKKVQYQYKSDISEIKRTKNKKIEQKCTFYNIETLYSVPEKVNDFSSMISEAKYKTIHGKRCPLDLALCLKILIPKQMFQRLPIALAQVKAGNTSENMI